MTYSYSKKKSLSKKGKVRVILAIILLIFIAFFCYLNYVVSPVVVEASEAKIKSVAQHTLSSSIYNIVASSNLYDELIKYHYDNNNKISMINVNSYNANILAREISTTAQVSLDTTALAGVSIHLGAFTGMAVFATSGPLINFNFSPIGTVSVQFRSEFISAGINQTLHKIYINVSSAVYVILPTASPRIDTSTEVLLTECVIVGDIPTTFLQSSYLDEMLNLVPV